MRVLIIARPWSFHGGIESATAGLLRALVAHGDDVHLLTPGAPPPVAGITVHRLRVPPLPSAGRVLALAALARRAARAGAWDVVQSHERVPGVDVYRAGEGCHAGYLASRDAAAGRALYHRAVLTLERRILATTPAIVAIARLGQAEIERLYAVPAARVTVVYNGVDLDRFHPAHRPRHRAALRTETGLGEDAWLTLFVGSGFARKGLATAIDAFARDPRPDARLAVVGRGDDRAYRAAAARAGVADRVLWAGARPDVDRWYAAADAVILPARYEPFGNVHLEALASGTPVVTSTRAGGAEVVTAGVNGAACDPHDAAAFAEAIAALRDVPAAERVERARYSAEPFTYARQVAELRRVWARLPTRKGR